MNPLGPAPGKAELRAALTTARSARGAAELARARAAIARLVRDRCASAGWRRVAAYVPLRTEPGSVQLLTGLRGAGARVLVPALLADRDLDWIEWDGPGVPEAAAVPLGVDAVAGVDAVLVPALAVAVDGTRLGRGGGSYDRALRRVTRAVPRIALVFDDEVRLRLPADPWDVPVSDAVTPSGWHRLGPPRPGAE